MRKHDKYLQYVLAMQILKQSFHMLEESFVNKDTIWAAGQYQTIQTSKTSINHCSCLFRSEFMFPFFKAQSALHTRFVGLLILVFFYDVFVMFL